MKLLKKMRAGDVNPCLYKWLQSYGMRVEMAASWGAWRMISRIEALPGEPCLEYARLASSKYLL